MRVSSAVIAVLTLLLASGADAAEPAALARARELYNAGSYEAAIEFASAARGDAGFGDAAALVMARARLERFRLDGNSVDLDAARETLAAIRSAALSARDQLDLVIGLGQALYLGETFGAAGELFETALARATLLAARDRSRLLDWWATALDREAQTRPPDRRPALFERITGRMEGELRDDPSSPVANYWVAVAARGEGDLDRAWDAASAAWVRASLAPETRETLRIDIDRLVTDLLIPERARARGAREQAEAAAALRAEWTLLKDQWR